MAFLKRVLTFSLLLMLLITAYKKDSDYEPANMGYRYFPVNPGHWAIYRVDSISWDDFTGTIDTFQYQIKEYYESEFSDNEGRTAVRIERYKRDNDTALWVIKDVWYACRTASAGEKVEENVRYLKMIFPVDEGAEWNGNVYNSLGAQDYTFSEAHIAYQREGLSFDSSLTVVHIDEQTLISRDYSAETYAAGAGLIYKKFIELETLPIGVITKGRDYSYTLLSWGDNP